MIVYDEYEPRGPEGMKGNMMRQGLENLHKAERAYLREVRDALIEKNKTLEARISELEAAVRVIMMNWGDSKKCSDIALKVLKKDGERKG